MSMTWRALLTLTKLQSCQRGFKAQWGVVRECFARHILANCSAAVSSFIVRGVTGNFTKVQECPVWRPTKNPFFMKVAQ